MSGAAVVMAPVEGRGQRIARSTAFGGAVTDNNYTLTFFGVTRGRPSKSRPPPGSIVPTRDDLIPGARPERPPCGLVNRLLDEPDRAVEQQDVHPPGVIARRGVEHVRVTAAAH